MPENVTPDTVSYLILGLVAIGAILLILIGSMALRYQNLKRDAQMLRELEAEDK
jgi:hypothetical protein